MQVQGRLEDARLACRPLNRTSGQLIALTCITGVNSLSGRLAASRAALKSVFDNDPRLAIQLRTWILETLADMAVRAGDPLEARQDLEAALELAPGDPYVRAAYADLLLDAHREAEVIDLLRDGAQQDNLLLRLAIAAARLHLPEAARWSNDYQARYEAARRDGDQTHLREQARFLLEVRGDSARALALSQLNWQVQHEPADVQIFLAAAQAVHDPAQAQPALQWIRQVGYEDAALNAVTSAAARVVQR